jgi:tyrosine decarboxylase / aspartate 1-decarboxylase
VSALREKGLSQREVLSKLKQTHAKDLRYEDGKILCAMCTLPHPTAQRAQQMFSYSNLGDPGLFPGSVELEKEAVASLSKLLHGTDSVGFIVSGGTEANLLAMLAARNQADVAEPEVILPESAHFSFSKICGMLKLKPVYAKLNGDFSVDPQDVKRQVNKRTIGIVGNAGSAELGAVDPIDELSNIAIDRGVYLHVDAAFGGLVLPFLHDLRYSVGKFDFSLEGVQSVTVDPHKMGFATVPAGGILFRDRTLLSGIGTETPYLTEECQYTFVGTRSGASAAAAWAVFESLGRDGFQKIVDGCMQRTAQLSEGLESLGFNVLIRPTLNIVAFRSDDTKALVAELRRRGWFVSYVPRLDCIRVVLMPHIKRTHVASFLKCLAELL